MKCRIIAAMSLRDLGFLGFCALGACTLSTAGTFQPTGGGDSGTGTGGGASTSGSAGAGMGGSTSTSSSTGAAGMGGSAGAAGMGGSAGAGGGMPVDWWDPAWGQRVRITFQNAGGQALTGFPVMVRLDAMRIKDSLASPTGADLRFIDDDGQTILAHEIDRWMPGGDSFVWVRVPTIDATDTDHIWLYYGNPPAMDAQNAAAVWNGFVGVYHLSPSGAPVQFADSAGTDAGAWANNDPGMIVAGPINEAVRLDGTRFVHVGLNDNVAADPGEARTAEAWINAAQLQDQAVVYEEGQCVGWQLGINAAGQYRGNFASDPDGNLCNQTNHTTVTTAASAGTWHYVALVVDRPGLEMRLFVDGTLTDSTPINNTNIADGNGVFRIGSDYNGGAGTFVGAIDEVRVSSSALSAAWIAAQHKSMTDTFLSFSAQ